MKKIIILSLLSIFAATILKAQTPLKLDHIFILIDTTSNIHNELAKVGLTKAKDWKTSHSQQGTAGEFFLFHNFYLEILYIRKQEEANENIENFGSNYVERSKWKNNTHFPFGLGLVLKDSTQSIPFETHTYNAKWIGEDNALKMAKNNKDLKEPLIFVEPIEWAYKVLENTEQLQIQKNTDAKNYRLNSLGIEKLTKVILIIPKKEKEFSKTLKALKKLNNVEINSGEKPLMILEFDTKKQKKELDFEKELRLIIKY